VEPGRRPGTYHVRYAIPRPPPLVSVVIPTRDRLALLQKCLKSLRNQTDYQPLEVLVVDNGSRQRQTKSYLEDLKRQGAARVLPFPQAFNYSAMNNLAAQEARGELLCLLNNDVQAIESGWLTEMVGLALQPGVGAVGAKLLYPNDTVQHAGMVGGLFGVVAHAYLREPREADGYLLQLQTTREVAAVTAACMVIRRDRFLQVGGLDKRDLPIGFNDVDLCFRLLKAGYRNLWTPYAELYHWESASRGTEQRGADRVRFLREESVLGQRWRALTERDPYYNPNLSLDSLVPRPAWPPRVVWPWMGER
jgi:GT2 family glycosyltransferase